jgi:hypothetical protein
MGYHCFTKTIGIDHVRAPHQGIYVCVWPVDVDVTMKMVSRPEGLDQPTERVDASVRQVYHIVCAPRR